MIIITTIIVISVVFLWGILWRNSSIIYPTLYRGDFSKRMVALTFDDGPDPGFTPQVLDILKSLNARATFFCVGRLVESNPEIVKRIHEEGHLLANHGFEHTWHAFIWTPGRMLASIARTGEALRKITGYSPSFYRPPVGIKTPAQAIAGWRSGQAFVGWTGWAVDGGRRALTLEKTQRLIDKTRNGDVFLLHDGKLDLKGNVMQNDAHGRAIAECLPVLIKGMQAKGFELVTLDRMFDVSPVKAAQSRPPGFRALFESLLREHASPSRMSFALGLGVLIGCSPFFGLHAFLGFMAAVRLRLNKLAVFAGTNISNPITGPFVVFGSIQVGWLILNGAWLGMSLEEMSSQGAWQVGNSFLASWLVGFPVVGALIGVVVTSVSFMFMTVRRNRP